VQAGSVQTSSLGCTWSADTWFTFSTTGWGQTAGDPLCASDSALELHYYDGGWQDIGWQHDGLAWIKRGRSPTTAVWAYHWVYVQGAWRQQEFTQEP
jgi:hypothetical protein